MVDGGCLHACVLLALTLACAGGGPHEGLPVTHGHTCTGARCSVGGLRRRRRAPVPRERSAAQSCCVLALRGGDAGERGPDGPWAQR